MVPWFGPAVTSNATGTAFWGLPSWSVIVAVTVWVPPAGFDAVVGVRVMPTTEVEPGRPDGLNGCLSSWT